MEYFDLESYDTIRMERMILVAVYIAWHLPLEEMLAYFSSDALLCFQYAVTCKRVDLFICTRIFCNKFF